MLWPTARFSWAPRRRLGVSKLGDLMRNLIAGAMFVASTLAAATAQAGFSEVRIGVLAHDPLTQKEDGVDINGEVFFDSWTDGSWELRPSIGGTVNLSGDTSMAYIDMN